MKILAGIDEAGLGPTLGPLVTASAALLVPEQWRPESPWEFLADAVCDKCLRRETRLVVADSKELYKTGGLTAFELSLGAFSLLANGRPSLPFEITPCDGGAAPHPCYSLSLDPFPAFCEPEALRAAAGSLAAALSAAGARTAHLEAVALLEPTLNSRFNRGLNKNEALLAETGRHLRRLIEKFPDLPLLIVVDKQGGRNAYLPFLSGLFPGTWIDEIEVGAAVSAYRLRRPGGDAEIRFQAKADRTSFATALASLAAKYSRERAMAELNAWFAERLPDLKPTAGYPEDARRWLAEVRSEKAGEELKIDLLVRLR